MFSQSPASQIAIELAVKRAKELGTARNARAARVIFLSFGNRPSTRVGPLRQADLDGLYAARVDTEKRATE